MAQKQLIVAVEGTAALAPYWHTILPDYLEKIVRAFAATNSTGQRTCFISNVEFNLVVFYSHGSHSACLVQRSAWTNDVDIFLQWLSALRFSGCVFNDAAIAEGLSEALMLFHIIPNESQNKKYVDFRRHCILVAASNPHPLPTTICRPQIQNLEPSENTEARTESYLSDVETVAKLFPRCSVSLSVICPKQLPKLRDIYNGGKQSSQAPDPPTYSVKNPSFLVLISENFMEARAALSFSGVMSLAPYQSPVKMDVAPVTSASGPSPTSIPPVNGSLMNWLPVSVENVPTANVKVEPTTVTSMIGSPAFLHTPSVPCAPQAVPSLQKSSPLTTSQVMMASGGNVQDVKPIVSCMTQPLHPVPQAQVMNSAALTGGTGNMIPNPHMPQQVQSGLSPGVNDSSAASMPLSQQNYVKAWEGNLFGQIQNQPVFITRLEGYRSSSASEALVADWPPTMQIVRLISQDHVNIKQHIAKVDIFVFQALIQHGFLYQLLERKLSAVIQLPSQTLLLSVFENKPCCLVGMLFPANTVVFKPQMPSHQQQLQQWQHQQLQPQQHSLKQQQQLQQLQQQQGQLPRQQLEQQLIQLPQILLQQQQQQLVRQQPMVGSGMNLAYVQGPGRSDSELVSQGQVKGPT
ncbi:hypothetical protein SLE2022_096380 [Rubroshorea leprosula]